MTGQKYGGGIVPPFMCSPFDALSAVSGYTVDEFQRSAARDDGSLAEAIKETTSYSATQDRLAAYRTGHTFGPDALAKLEGRQSSFRAVWETFERYDEPAEVTSLGSRAAREIRLKRDPSWLTYAGDEDED